jgi:hypothetical protein
MCRDTPEGDAFMHRNASPCIPYLHCIKAMHSVQIRYEITASKERLMNKSENKKDFYESSDCGSRHGKPVKS